MMYSLPDFAYLRPGSLEEALELLSKYGEDARVLAGGTDLLLDMKIGRYRPKYVIDIGHISELRYITDSGGALRIGALTTIQDLLESPLVAERAPLIAMAAERFAYWQIRNAATIGGNLCNASPAADMAPPLLVYEAAIRARSSRGERLIPITEFFLGPRRTAMRPDELLVEVVVPYSQLSGAGFAYAKIGRRAGHDISLVAVAVALKLADGVIDDARIALNSVAPTPVRAKSVEGALIGRAASPELFEEASKLVINDISPISDVRAPAEYRSYMSRLLVRELLMESFRRAKWGGSE